MVGQIPWGKKQAFRIIHDQEIEYASLTKTGFLDNPQKLFEEKDCIWEATISDGVCPEGTTNMLQLLGLNLKEENT